MIADSDGNDYDSERKALQAKDEALANGARVVTVTPLYECVSLRQRYEAEVTE